MDVTANYLTKYADFLRYDEYLAEGLPIATGVIEGACRYLVKDRMEKTGARRHLTGAEAVLRLRSLRASGHFDELGFGALQVRRRVPVSLKVVVASLRSFHAASEVTFPRLLVSGRARTQTRAGRSQFRVARDPHRCGFIALAAS